MLYGSRDNIIISHQNNHPLSKTGFELWSKVNNDLKQKRLSEH
jgi:hypothetical protein